MRRDFEISEFRLKMFWNKHKKNRKWDERPQLYKGRFFYLKQVSQIFLAVFGVVSILALLNYFRHSEALSIQKVEIMGELKHITKDQVLKLSGLKQGDKLFTASFSDVRENILRFSWIEAVRIRREFPDTIQIFVTERQPMALLLAGSLYLMDESGKIFKKVDKGEALDLPVVTGFDQDKLEKYPYLMKSYLKVVVNVLKYFQEQDFYQNDPVSEVHFDSVAGITVFTKNNGLEVFYGRGDFELKHKSLEKFKLSKYFNNANFVRLDLDSNSRIIARMGRVVSNDEER